MRRELEFFYDQMDLFPRPKPLAPPRAKQEGIWQRRKIIRRHLSILFAKKNSAARNSPAVKSVTGVPRLLIQRGAPIRLRENAESATIARQRIMAKGKTSTIYRDKRSALPSATLSFRR
jgi:hypothetical protein